ncbi:MAG: HD domain-containing protein [bacterium]|nr:HD domain-containing protein [bacterium]
MAQKSRLSFSGQPLDQASFLAYFLGAVVPLAALVYVTQKYIEVARLQEGLEGTLFQSRPFILGLILSIGVLSLASFLALRRVSRQALARMDSENQRLVALLKENEELQEAQRNFFIHITHILTSALDSHLGYHSDHSSNVARLSVRLGRRIRLDPERLERLHFAALLHDIGMLKIDGTLLEDKRALRKHSEIGAEMLESISLWQDLAPFVLHHHEWFDGNGYPEEIEGEAIPLESRIIGLAEAFDSMTSSVSYKAAIDVPQALERIKGSSGTQFDPRLAKAFVELAEDGELQPG